jgi:hypothetical protein
MAEMIRIHTPAGECPAKLRNTDRTMVETWIDSVVDAGHKKNLHYLPPALKYFAANFYDRGTDEWAEICSIIDEVCIHESPQQTTVRVEVEKRNKSRSKTRKLISQSVGKIAQNLQRGSDDEIRIN